MVLSADGRRLAWLFAIAGLPEENDPDYSKRRGRAEFWVSDAEGAGMRRVGWLPTYPGRTSWSKPAGEEPESLQWTPDNKHLSFVYEDALYTVPVD